MWVGGFDILEMPSHPFLDGVACLSYVLDFAEFAFNQVYKVRGGTSNRLSNFVLEVVGGTRDGCCRRHVSTDIARFVARVVTWFLVYFVDVCIL